MTAPIRSAPDTGASGNLGQKRIAGLLRQEGCEHIVALDRALPATSSNGLAKVRWVEGDLAMPRGSSLCEAMAGGDAVVHFAAQTHYPDAPWSDASASFDMTLALLGAVSRAGLKRIVFASTNHVMGQYKDPPLAEGLTEGALTTDLPPGPGTRWFNGREMVQGFTYAASKLMGERACLAEAHRSGGALTNVCVRTGWCQPGENRPETINTSGLPGEDASIGPDTERDLRWFRNMWLSNRDSAALWSGRSSPMG